MQQRPYYLTWRPSTLLGRVFALAFALSLFAVLLVVSVAAVFLTLVALAVYVGYGWYRSWRFRRTGITNITRHPDGGLVIDVVPERETVDRRR